MLLIVEDITKEIKQRYDVDLNSYANKLLISTINKRMFKLDFTMQQTYLDFFHTDPDEAVVLLQQIGVNVSSFFRNPMVYSILEQRILPELIERKRKQGLNEIRIWSAGCASGEEPYSIAILIHQLLKKSFKQWRIHIFATDIDRESLNQAVQGTFSRDRLQDTRLGIYDAYFTRVDAGYSLAPEVRQMVNFSFEDLLSSGKVAPAASIFGSFDLILCRNVLIYFNKSAQKVAIQKFIKTLTSKSYLILGESECIDKNLKSAFMEIDIINRIYKTK